MTGGPQSPIWSMRDRLQQSPPWGELLLLSTSIYLSKTRGNQEGISLEKYLKWQKQPADIVLFAWLDSACNQAGLD